jgi:3-oxoacyl-[acyl-carrier-protein] synthase-3
MPDSDAVYITRSSAYLPFDSIGNDEMEEVLGRVAGRNSRARPLVLRRNGIVSRHYAIDRTSGKQAMTNAQLCAKAIEGLGPLEHVDVLAAGTSIPDDALYGLPHGDIIRPGHADRVFETLRWPRMTVMSYTGICLSSIAALKSAYLAIAAGDAQRAVVVGSEIVSPVLRGEKFEPEIEAQLAELEIRPEIAFEKDFLRWMLSDGAGTVLLETQPRGSDSLRIEWIELSSAAHELDACMYMGADKDAGGSLQGWATFSPEQRTAQSVFAIKQDVRLLNENIVTAAFSEPLKDIIQRRGLKAPKIDWFLPHLSSKYFFELVATRMDEIDFHIPRERWFTNLFTKGNTGSAAPFIMLDELMQSGRIQPGQRLLMFVPESGRFSSAFISLIAD